MFFKKPFIGFMAAPLVIIMIWVKGVVILLYQITFQYWWEKRKFDEKKKNTLSLYRERTKLKMSAII